MADWVANSGGGDVTVKVWLEVGGQIVLKRPEDDGDGDNYVSVATNSDAEPDLEYAEVDPRAPKAIPYEVEVSALSEEASEQTLWHRLEQGGHALPAYDADLQHVQPGPNGGIALDPDCTDGADNGRIFSVRFR